MVNVSWFFHGRTPLIFGQSSKFFLSHTPSMLFPYPPVYLQLAFLPKVHTEAITEWTGDSTAETSNLLLLLKELGLMHYLIAVIEQTATREDEQVFAGIKVAGIKLGSSS